VVSASHRDAGRVPTRPPAVVGWPRLRVCRDPAEVTYDSARRAAAESCGHIRFSCQRSACSLVRRADHMHPAAHTLLLSSARLRKAKAAESRLASLLTTTALAVLGTSAAATAAAKATAAAAAGGAPGAAASPACASSACAGEAASPGSGGAPATPGVVAVNGREAAASTTTTGRTVESLASGAAASVAAWLPSAPFLRGGSHASPCAGASPAVVASAAVARRAAASAGV